MSFNEKNDRMEISNMKEADAENRKFYRETFDEVHASSELLGKVLDMKKDQKNKVFRSIAKLGYVAAAGLVIAMVSTNAISYAQTGSTWVEKVIVYINGAEQEAEAVYSVDEDGNEQMELELNLEDESIDDGVNVAVEWKEETADADAESDGTSERKNDAEDAKQSSSDKDAFRYQTSELKEEDGRIYLLINGDDIKIDVTEDIKDEKCEGTFEKDGETWNYEVTGNLDGYGLVVTK